MRLTVAVDGPAAAGKGTVARAVAAHFGLAHMDTGLLYRAVGRRMLDGADPIEAAHALVAADLDGPGLRAGDVAQAASKAAAIPQVRVALVDFQRAFAARSGGAVLDGRDIGTVICPDAEAKLFVTATPEVRAARRHADLTRAGEDIDYAAVLTDIRERDARDEGRADAPLRPAEDAMVLDTSKLDIEEAVSRAIALVGAAREAGRKEQQ